MFTNVRMAGCRDFDYRTGADCRRVDVPLMLLCFRWERISYVMLSGRDIESMFNKIKGMCEGGLRVVCVRVTN